MIILYFLFIPIFYISIKLILFFIVSKFGKFSHKGFSAAGFAYEEANDLFYSTKNAWQKNFGYTHIYDVWAPIFRMIIDTEPIKFYYNNKNWLITFWKGQYGIVTGAEIGIYATSSKNINKKTLYLPIKDNDLIHMSIILYKNNQEVARISAKHWWLTVFKLGMFSKPKELSMDVSITFPDRGMLNAFLTSFTKLGYKSKDFKVIGKTFYFLYKRPRTKKVWTRTWLSDSITQFLNHRNVKLYNKYLADVIETDYSNFPNNKKLIIVNDLIPNILKNHKDNHKISTTTNNFFYFPKLKKEQKRTIKKN